MRPNKLYFSINKDLTTIMDWCIIAVDEMSEVEMAGTRRSLRERKKAETRQAILTAACELFRRRGFDATSLDEIAARANVSRSTLFNYFASKDALLAEIAAAEMASLAQLVRDEWDGGVSAADKIRRMMLLLVSEEDPRLQVTRRVLLESMLHPEAIPAPVARMESLLIGLVREAQAAGDIRADYPAVSIARWTVGAYLAALTFQRWLAAEEENTTVSPDEIERTVDMLFGGLAGPEYRTGDKAKG